MSWLRVWISCVALAAAACDRSRPDQMTFFVTSVPAGPGGAIGGVAGADAHCQRLAEAVGSRGRTWRAYLSAPASDTTPAVHARDRIGRGPWVNLRGVEVASSVGDLHGPNTRMGRQAAITETDKIGLFPHDILTGSNPDGTLASGDMTCRGWKSTVGYAMFGHSDRQGGRPNANSWNSAHQSDGCTAEAFRSTGGNGLFYCFAVD